MQVHTEPSIASINYDKMVMIHPNFSQKLRHLPGHHPERKFDVMWVYVYMSVLDFGVQFAKVAYRFNVSLYMYESQVLTVKQPKREKDARLGYGSG